MGLSYNVYLTANKIFGCKGCKTHLADYNDIISRVRIQIYIYVYTLSGPVANAV
jgi:hypothetical protein